MVEVFRADHPNLLSALREALNSSDGASFMRAAHSLKGMLLNFQSEPTAAIARALEEKGRSGDLSGAGPLIEELAAGLAHLDRDLADLLARAPAGS